MLGDESHRPDKHRAFALEGRGSWHALSLSLAQQIVGPVRALAGQAGPGGRGAAASTPLRDFYRCCCCFLSSGACSLGSLPPTPPPPPPPHAPALQVRARLDARFALDPTNVPANERERSTLKGLAQTALSVRPGLLEAVVGCDVVLPGTEGVGRLAVWYSPKRREAMAELRLF